VPIQNYAQTCLLRHIGCKYTLVHAQCYAKLAIWYFVVDAIFQWYYMTTYSFHINQAVGPLKMWAGIKYNVILPQFDR